MTKELGPRLYQENQNILAFKVGDIDVAVPKKELYGIKDIGEAVGYKNMKNFRSKLLDARRLNPTILTQRVEQTPTMLAVDEENFQKSVTTIMAMTHPDQDQRIKIMQSLQPSLREAASMMKKAGAEDLFVTLPDGDKLPVLDPDLRKTLSVLIAAGGDGVAVRKLAEHYIESISLLPLLAIKTAAKDIRLLRIYLEANWIIEDITPSRNKRLGKRAVYVLRSRKPALLSPTNTIHS